MMSFLIRFWLIKIYVFNFSIIPPKIKIAPRNDGKFIENFVDIVLQEFSVYILPTVV